MLTEKERDEELAEENLITPKICKKVKHVTTNETFITGTRILDSGGDGSSESMKGEQRITEYVCPPPPTSVKPLYYSLNDFHCRHALSDWEKKILLSRLTKHPELQEEIFQQRLSHVPERNGERYIVDVQRLKERENNKRIKALLEEFNETEERRNELVFRSKNLVLLKIINKFISRSELWYTIIVSHVFLTSLIKERQVQEAMETFSFLLAPMVRRYVALLKLRREQEALTQKMLSEIPYPSPQIIKSMYGKFFNGWPDNLLELLASKARPTYMKQGKYLMHQGDVGRSMYMITLGEILIIFKKKSKSKKRNIENSTGTLALKAPCYVGEFALVCKEPRSASIVCQTDIGFWAISPEDYDDVARFLNAEVASQQREATDARRRENLKKLFPLKAVSLRKWPYFEKFSEEGLTKIADTVEPIILHDGDFLIEKGVLDTSVYFIQDGIALNIDEDGRESNINRGTCVGMFECSCGVNEKKNNSIVSINYCDIWRMPRDLLMDIGLSEPNALFHCRKAARKERAMSIKKDAKPPPSLRFDPYLNFCFLSSYVSRIHQLCSSCVFLNGERIILMGQALTSLIIIVKGALDITVANNGEQETFRISTTQLSEKKGSETFANTRGYTFVLGAYEYAASLNKFTCTAHSFGVTEAYTVNLSDVNAILPPELSLIIKDNLRAKEIIGKAFSELDLSILQANKNLSFASVFRARKDNENHRMPKKI